MKRNRYSVRKSRRRWVIYRNDLFLDQAMTFSKAILIAQERAAKDPVVAAWDREHREWVSAERRASRIAEDYLRHARGEL